MDTLQQTYETLCRAGKCSDKGTTHSYIPFYDDLFAGHHARPIRLLELGVFNGHSLELWAEHFRGSEVWGMDIREVAVSQAATLVVGDCTDPTVVEALPGWWDIVIDDASHRVDDQIAAFRLLRPRLAPGALYVIEDLQSMADVGAICAATGVLWRTVDLRAVKGRYDDVLMVHEI